MQGDAAHPVSTRPGLVARSWRFVRKLSLGKKALLALGTLVGATIITVVGSLVTQAVSEWCSQRKPPIAYAVKPQLYPAMVLIPATDHDDMPTPPWEDPRHVSAWDNGDVTGWAEANGAHSPGHFVSITVHGVSDETVRLTDLRVNVVDASPAPAVVLYARPEHFPPGLEIAENRSIAFNLDTGQRIAPEVPDGLREARRVPAMFPYSVSISDPETFDVFVFTERCDCAYVFDLDWAARGRTGTMIIDDDGAPFRAVGMGGGIAGVCVEGATAVPGSPMPVVC
ncbi:hypothetical protein [Hoyosella subflava]|uniref:Uncharacterized protein n=1 Tax=Hoyosella subflava (strain DSM 45089 / JCM 17490 / NBRC 109087 / DQS3-9A1) TaxID=443218 RepID=F6ELJ2_HOYSD|nr:hypothetical protein [Hoyosella subflava]AEF40242.1 hypothetical protein AS9A_1793 [Hoyosella subflava DQS3-9A1]